MSRVQRGDTIVVAFLAEGRAALLEQPASKGAPTQQSIDAYLGAAGKFLRDYCLPFLMNMLLYDYIEVLLSAYDITLYRERRHEW